jgi:hypothetical protein
MQPLQEENLWSQNGRKKKPSSWSNGVDEKFLKFVSNHVEPVKVVGMNFSLVDY